MRFKNDLERRCFEVAKRVLGDDVAVEHNKAIKIESALFAEVASFKGPPAKEIDVLVAQLLDKPKVVLLTSCKSLSRPAEPAHVQEWCAVVHTMNKFSEETMYFGLVLSPTGFTSGCESWATSHNVGILPPLKGRRLAFNEETVLQMFERVLRALQARVRFRTDDLQVAPAFSEFVYGLAADYEGHQEAASAGRYYLLPREWTSSFGEMYSAIGGRAVENLVVVNDGTVIDLSGGVSLRFTGTRVDFGPDRQMATAPPATPRCQKNIDYEACTLDFIRSIVIGKSISSAGDFGKYIEFGLDGRFNLGLHPDGFHLISTESPIEEHRL